MNIQQTGKTEEFSAPAVKIGMSRQVVIPRKIHDKLGLTSGDYLGVEVKKGQIIFTPKTLIEKEIAEGLEDIKEGRVSGPFASADDVIAHLHLSTKNQKK